MNSEISNVLKLPLVTVVKADERLPSGVKEESTMRGSALPASPDAPLTLSSDLQQNGNENIQKPSFNAVKDAAEHGNSLLQAVNRNLQFQVDDSTREVVVKIVDSESGEVVRQIPSEEMLAFIKRMQELDGQQGSVIQDRA
jgi:flagellar protein FlaG